jgi:hypothetical protein
MTLAGESAGLEAQRQRRRAAELGHQAAEAIVRADRFEVAHRTEEETARTLAPLAAIGYHLLADRRWPGSRTAQVDMVVVGPGGVFIVDTKAWAEVTVAEDRIFRGQEDVTDDVARLADLAYAAEAVLAEIGLPSGEVHAVAALAGRRGVASRVASVDVIGVGDLIAHITRRGRRLSHARVDEVLAATMQHFTRLDGDPSPAPDCATVSDPVLPRAELPSLISEEELHDMLLDGVLDAPIEDWMASLDPSQAKLVRRNFNGPARIRGAAGTGKTVVGLHRAAYLARSGARKVLFATYIRTLPSVLEQLLGRLAPDMVGRVDFVGVHQFARRLLVDRGVPFRIDERAASTAFGLAWDQVGAQSPLRSARFSRRYWEDEIQYVIKGRGLTRFEQYADLARVGRRHALTVEQRQAAWDLHEAYDCELRERRLTDWQDIILLARASLAATPLDGYDAVIVDEAQDLSCSMVSMLHSIVGDRPDGLTLIGDGQQTIYPGGYTLGEVGISLAGRGVVLDVNHRNTAEILAFAKSVVTGDEFTDIEGTDGSGDQVSAVSRSGPRPTVERFTSGTAHDAGLVARVRSALRFVGTTPGDVGVLTRTNSEAERCARVLVAAGIPVVSLKDYDGRPVDSVKVGTIKRAKGLEFKQVLLPRVDPALLDAAAEVPEADRERRELERRELYVGMTRARDGLWVGTR